MEIIPGLVTVVVPVYKVEPYLDRCVSSLVNQSYANLEIILVDDGSPDGCPRMCDEWAAKDHRIKVIHKKNAGQGLARNTGMEQASGEYVYFVDSDDYIALDTIEKCYKEAKKVDADVVTFGYSEVNSAGQITRVQSPHPEQYLYEGREVQERFLPDLIGPDTAAGRFPDLWMSASASIYRLETLRRAEWQFVSEREIISEDFFSSIRLYKDIERVAILPEAFYFYCQNGSSFSHTYKSERFEKLKSFYDCCIRECEKSGYSEEVKKRVAYPFISLTISALKLIARADFSASEKRKKMNEIFRDKKFRAVLAQTNIQKEKTARRLLLYAIRWRLYPLCRAMVRIKA